MAASSVRTPRAPSARGRHSVLWARCALVWVTYCCHCRPEAPSAGACYRRGRRCRCRRRHRPMWTRGAAAFPVQQSATAAACSPTRSAPVPTRVACTLILPDISLGYLVPIPSQKDGQTDRQTHTHTHTRKPRYPDRQTVTRVHTRTHRVAVSRAAPPAPSCESRAI
jgi:hypothetical protein